MEPQPKRVKLEPLSLKEETDDEKNESNGPSTKTETMALKEETDDEVGGDPPKTCEVSVREVNVKSEVDEKVVVEFFKKFLAMLREDDGQNTWRLFCDKGLDNMIQNYPYLAKIKCPEGLGREGYDDPQGNTALECLCETTEHPTCDQLEVIMALVDLGAEATDKCYDSCWQDYGYWDADKGHELLLSGHMPLEQHFFLDTIFRGIDEPEMINDILRLFLGMYEVGEDMSQVTADRVKTLPKLEAGVTHEAGGDFEKYLEEFKKENEQD